MAIAFLTHAIAIIMQRYAETDGELERALAVVKGILTGAPGGVEGQ